MSNEKKKCPQCGAINKGAQTVCLLCKANLGGKPTGTGAPKSPSRPQNVPGSVRTPPSQNDPGAYSTVEVKAPVNQSPNVADSAPPISTPKGSSGFGAGCIGLLLIIVVVGIGAVALVSSFVPQILEIVSNNESENESPTPTATATPDVFRSTPEPFASPVPTREPTLEPEPTVEADEDYDPDGIDFGVVPTPRPQTRSSGVSTQIWGDNVTIRSTPSLSGRKVGSLVYYERVTHIRSTSAETYWKGSRCKWAYIRKSNGTEGWVFGYFVEGKMCSQRDYDH